MAPTETLVIDPTISIAILGGTVSPMIAEAARTAAPSPAPCSSRNWSRMTVPTAATSAGFEPDGDCDLKETPAPMADQRMDETHKPHADAAALHNQPGQDEKRDREQNEIAGPVHHSLWQHDKRAGVSGPKVSCGRKQQHKTDGYTREDHGKEQR